MQGHLMLLIEHLLVHVQVHAQRTDEIQRHSFALPPRRAARAQPRIPARNCSGKLGKTGDPVTLCTGLGHTGARGGPGDGCVCDLSSSGRRGKLTVSAGPGCGRKAGPRRERRRARDVGGPSGARPLPIGESGTTPTTERYPSLATGRGPPRATLVHAFASLEVYIRVYSSHELYAIFGFVLSQVFQ